MTINEPAALLDYEIHVRITQELNNRLRTISDSYGLGKSTLARIIIQQQIENYTKNRLWG